MASRSPLRVGYVPEHFSTPLHFAVTHFSLACTLVPFPSGTGHMITSLQANEIDIGIGLTEGWVAGLGKTQIDGNNAGYKLVGTYVETPLCWAISTGANRTDVTSVADLKGKKCGVSRIGSGSYIMSFVLADLHSWLPVSLSSPLNTAPFEHIPLQTFEMLRDAVNDGSADFFMWEHFTSKRYYSNGSIKKVGEIYTPWPSWHVVAQPSLLEDRSLLEDFFQKLNLGVKYFEEHHDEAVEYISTRLDYSAEDAKEWLGTVRFAGNVKGVRGEVVRKTVGVLEKAGVLRGLNVDESIGIQRKA
ncbi:hypothetical protein MMC21_003746 [Puttea exsequens]|nr:hypothetical protein [Puttea exsequens]